MVHVKVSESQLKKIFFTGTLVKIYSLSIYKNLLFVNLRLQKSPTEF